MAFVADAEFVAVKPSACADPAGILDTSVLRWFNFSCYCQDADLPPGRPYDGSMLHGIVLQDPEQPPALRVACW